MVLDNPFYNNWRDCLQAHLGHVIREGDHSNEQSLITVLRDTGYSDEELHEMRRQVLESLGVWETNNEECGEAQVSQESTEGETYSIEDVSTAENEGQAGLEEAVDSSVESFVAEPVDESTLTPFTSESGAVEQYQETQEFSDQPYDQLTEPQEPLVVEEIFEAGVEQLVQEQIVESLENLSDEISLDVEEESPQDALSDDSSDNSKDKPSGPPVTQMSLF